MDEVERLQRELDERTSELWLVTATARAYATEVRRCQSELAKIRRRNYLLENGIYNLAPLVFPDGVPAQIPPNRQFRDYDKLRKAFNRIIEVMAKHAHNIDTQPAPTPRRKVTNRKRKR